MLSEYKHVVTVHPDFPSPQYRGDSDERFSPFLAAVQRSEGRLDLLNKTRRVARFHILLDDGGQVIQLINNYNRGQWDAFRRKVKEYIGDVPLEARIDRNRALYQLLELAFMAVVTCESHKSQIERFSSLLSKLRSRDENELVTYIRSIHESGLLPEIQRDLLEVTARFIELADEFRPVMSEWDPDTPSREFPDGLHVSGRANFDDVKWLYVDAFEAGSRALTALMGLINLDLRGTPSSFAPHPTIGKGEKPFAGSLGEFHADHHGKKPAMLDEVEWLDTAITGAFDSKLRNAVGHNSISYEWREDRARYALNPSGSKYAELSYGGFLFRILHAVLGCHQLNHLVKMLYVHLLFDEEGGE